MSERGLAANSTLSAVKQALAVRRARAGQDSESLGSEPIAVIGLACRLPGDADTPEIFWQNLCAGVNSVSQPPPGRSSCGSGDFPAWAGYLRKIDSFDAGYFAMSSREAEHLDPQQRLLLEVTWESLWNSGVEPESLGGSRTGVFTAVYNGYYERMLLNHPSDLNAYSGSGTATSAASGRVAFLLDLRGPAVSINTACSSSLVTAHLACQSLRAGDCDLVLVGGVNLKLSAEEMITAAQMGLLAPDGRAKTFDAGANGFVPGEGCVVAVFKRLSDALADGDHIRAVIRGTALNQDGRTSTLTAPSGLAQREVIRAAAVDGRIDLSQVTFIETHGTGTALGDPIEVESLAEALGPHGPDARPCLLGSVKTNIGHLEAAAGMAGLAKVVLTLENEAIPGNLHFERLNPHITLEGTRFVIPTSLHPWPRGPEPRWAGLSSFGFSGTNAHMILEEAPAIPSRRAPLVPHNWQRKQFWFVPRSAEGGPSSDGRLALRKVRSAASTDQIWEIELSSRDPGFLGDHQIGGDVLLPMTVMVELMLAASGESALEHFEIERPLVLQEDKCVVQVVIRASGEAELFSESGTSWKRHARAWVAHAAGVAPPLSVASLKARITREENPEAHYSRLEDNGIRFGPAFRTVRQLWRAEDEALGRIQVDPSQDGNYRLDPLLLDGGLQVVGALLADAGMFLPVQIGRLTLRGHGPYREVWSYLRLRKSEKRGLIEFDVDLFDGSGAAVANLESVQLRRREEGADDWLYEVAWRESPPSFALR